MFARHLFWFNSIFSLRLLSFDFMVNLLKEMKVLSDKIEDLKLKLLHLKDCL